MIMKIKGLLYIAASLSLIGCFETGKKSTATEQVQEKPLEVPQRETYQATETRVFDLIHTKLDVSFDWENRQLDGTAELSVKPYFHAQNSIELDAKAMDIHEVAIIDTNMKQNPLKFTYDSLVINITLDKEYTRKDTLSLFIKYTANPEKVSQKGSAAINDAKGLYFINHDGTHPEKPQQIWTQGETESSSCWFPTIDIPNEKMTQEIKITVDNKYQTLSNGVKVMSMESSDGKRTDYWRQEKPHAPYLAMMAIGEFSIIEHDWDDIKVHYFIEQKDSIYAELVFGRTPEMLTFYSEKLGYKYPWEKYDQIIVRDFISGAMENTGAVIHGEFVMQDSSEYLDGNYEDYVAHELFHHWFGDLITCESWANLPLNESFATYGEYLWREHKYGNDFADMALHDFLDSYLWEAEHNMKDMIRYNYEDKEDMFDSHSYQKGGTILHMLRRYLGDEVFFASVEYYLHENAFKTTEIHDLRQAFEHISGEDLNWFFDQWFMDKGHPVLHYSYKYDSEVDSIYINVKQMQDLNKVPLYRLPIDIDLYYGSKSQRTRIWVDEMNQTIAIPSNGKPDNVNFDATKSITCEKLEEKSIEEWAHQFTHAKIYRDRFDALDNALELHADSASMQLANDIIWSALDDNSEYIRLKALDAVELLPEQDSLEVKGKLLSMSQNDKSSDVRSEAIAIVSSMGLTEEDIQVIRKSLVDPSHLVKAYAIEALYLVDKSYMMAKIHEYNSFDNNHVVRSVSKIYGAQGSDAYKGYFEEKMTNFSTRKGYITTSYVEYLKKQNESVVKEGIAVARKVTEDEDYSMYDRLSSTYVVIAMLSYYQNRIADLNKDIADQKAANSGKQTDVPAMEHRLKRVEETYNEILTSIKSIMENASETEKMYYQAWMAKFGITL